MLVDSEVDAAVLASVVVASAPASVFGAGSLHALIVVALARGGQQPGAEGNHDETSHPCSSSRRKRSPMNAGPAGLSRRGALRPDSWSEYE